MADIAVIDYGMGNLRSVQQALRTVAPNASIVVTGDPDEVVKASRVVFPGQGAMPDCMRELDARGLRAAVQEAARMPARVEGEQGAGLQHLLLERVTLCDGAVTDLDALRLEVGGDALDPRVEVLIGQG